jgi:hypothetical protein
MGTLFPVFVIVLLLWAIYRIDLLQQRVERLHVKVNAIRQAVAPNGPQGDTAVSELRSGIDVPVSREQS